MAFSSIHFIFLFLPIAILLYSVLPKGNWRNSVLVLSSLVFFTWSDSKNLHVLFLSVLINYTFGIFISNSQEKENTGRKRILVWIAVILNLLLLFFYKYLGFFGEIFNSLINLNISIKEQTLPLGISYFTFSGLAYILDISRRIEKSEKNILKFASFLIMFPKLIQGPITQYRDIKDGFSTKHISQSNFAFGVRRFIIGLAKKMLLADNLLIASNQVFEVNFNRIGADVAWFGLITYTLVIYLDFSAYTDMALGIGKILGFNLPENFNYPYISRSITDFWRRWHMSLTNWFRNYVFLPLEVSRRKEKHFRQQTNILIVFILTGLWHGASWNFVIWGGYFGFILAIEASGFRKLLQKMPKVVQHAYTMGLVMMGWIFFRLTNLQHWGQFFRALLGANGWTHLETLRSLNIIFYIPVAIIAVVLSLPLFTKFNLSLTGFTQVKKAAIDLGFFGLLILSIAYLLANGFEPFMYAQF